MKTGTDQPPDFDNETIDRIEDRVLREEKEQLSYRRPHNIIPKLKEIVEEEVPEAEVDSDTDQ